MGTTKESVLDYKPKPPRVTGVITINHALRVEMKLGPLEYILMDTIVHLKKIKKPVLTSTVYARTGLIEQEQSIGLKFLVEKGFIYPSAEKDGSPNLSGKWDSFFQSVEAEFDDFWSKDGKVCWQGSKSKAQSLYVALRKKESKDRLINQRNEYFRFLDLLEKSQNFRRAKMQATRFLGPQEDYNQDWTSYCKEEEEKIKKEEALPEAAEEKPSTATKADRLKKYEDKG